MNSFDKSYIIDVLGIEDGEKLNMNEIIKEGTATFKVRNETIEVMGEYRFDLDTNTKVADEKLDQLGQEKAVEIYREKNDILNANDIKEIRGIYGLSQRAFAKLTGIGVATIARYETGQMPTKANNELLKSAGRNFQMVQNLFKINGDKLSEKDQKKVQTKLDEVQTKNTTVKDETKPSFDTEKVKALVIFFAQEIEALTKSKLNILLFYTDFKHYQLAEQSMSGLDYEKDYNGPAPVKADHLYADLRQEDAIDWRLLPSGEGEYITPQAECELDLFNETELEVMINVVDEFGGENAKSLSERVQSVEAYKEIAS